MPELLDRRQAANLLKVGVITLDRLRKAGKLSYVKIGGLIRFTPEDIENCIKNLKVSA